MAERSLRDRASVSKSALLRERLEAIKAGGRSRLADHELDVEEELFEDVDEEEYARRAKRERDEGFIEDDGGGYGDDDDDVVYTDEEDGPERRKTKAPVARGALNQPAQRKPARPPAKRPAASLLASRAWQPGGGGSSAGAAVVPTGSGGGAGAGRVDDAFIDSLLGDLGAPAAPAGGGFGASAGARAGAARPGAAKPARSARDQVLSGRVGALDTPAPRARPSAVAFRTAERARTGGGAGGGFGGGLGGGGLRASHAADVAALLAAGGGDGAADEGIGADEDYTHDEPRDDGADGADGTGARADGGAAACGDSALGIARPFSAAQEQGDGDDWFKVCLEAGAPVAPAHADAAAGGAHAPPSVTGGAADGAGGGGGGGSGGGSGAASLPPLEEDGSLRFYFLDAYEDAYNQPGTLHLFGKAATGAFEPPAGAGGGAAVAEPRYASICVTMRNLTRHLFVAPREGAGMNDVYAEVHQLLRKHGVSTFRCKPVRRSYAFDEAAMLDSAPAHSPCLRDAPFLKVVYDGGARALPSGLSGETFVAIFGAGTSQTEHLLIKRRIRGPCWLVVRGAQPPASACSWCRFEAVVTDGRKAITVLGAEGAQDVPPAPPLRVLSLRVQTVVSDDRAKSNHVVLASAIVHDGVRLDSADPAAALASRPRPAAHGGGGVSAFSVLRKLDDQIWPWDLKAKIAEQRSGASIELTPNERALLQYLIAKIHAADPDVIVGHNVAGFEIQVLLQRMQAHSIQQWSKLGRLKRSRQPSTGGGRGNGLGGDWLDWSVVCGRLLADTYLCARELLLGQRSYALRELAATQLDVHGKEDVDPGSIKARLLNADSAIRLVRLAENDAFLSLRLLDKLQVLPLTRQLTKIAGNLWAHSLKGQRAERIEYLLLHKFHELKYVCPDKLTRREREAKSARRASAGRGGTSGGGAAAANGAGGGVGGGGGGGGDGEFDGGDDDVGMDDVEMGAPAVGGGGGGGGGGPARKKPAYAGGLVLEPKKGLYDHYVLLLDFNSLYPSIVQEYNLCFTTVERPATLPDGSLPPPQLPEQGTEPGVLPDLIKQIVEKRRAVKQLLAKESDAARRAQLDTRQKALKIMANSMYGCLGFSGSRFYARPIAELICSTGRATLQRTVDVAEANGLEVIYGDTDSIMIHSRTKKLTDARAMAGTLKKEVNRLYKCLEIEVDGIFEMMLLLKKKKYAALTVTAEDATTGRASAWARETKGLDLVRRDWCTLSRKVGSAVLDLLLSTRAREEIVEALHEYLRSVAADVRANKLPIQDYVVSKSLSKPPSEYPDGKSQPHVQVALQLLARGEAVAPGSVIEYVVCESRADPAAAGADGMAGGATALDGADAPAATTAVAAGQPSVGCVGKSLAERARHPSTVLAAGGALAIDREWYLSNQIHPPVARLVDVIEGTDSARIAECLGLDPAKFAGASGAAGGGAESIADEVFGAALQDDEARFRDAVPLLLPCAACGETSAARPLHAALASPIDGRHPTLACQLCGEEYDRFALHNLLTLAMRAAERAYYTSSLVCEEASCGEVSRTLSAFISTDENGQPLFPHSARELHTQLLYLERLFDVSYAQRRVERAHRRRPAEQPAWVPLNADDRAACEVLVAHVRSRLSDCAFNAVNMRELCSLVRGCAPAHSSHATLALAAPVA